MWINQNNFLEKLRKKDEKALNYVIDKYSNVVIGVVRKVLACTKDEGLIEECIYDVFISVWNNIDKFKGDTDSFKNWIAGVSRYRAIDYYRKEKKRLIEIEFSNEIGKKENVESILDEIVSKEEIKELKDTIDSYSEPDRSIIIMKVFLGYKTSRIAESLNMTNSNVDTRFSRVRKKLRKIYNSNGGV